MDPITITTTAAKTVSTTLQVVQTCNEYYQKYKAVDLQLVCMQTQCSIIEVALLQIQDVIVHDSARFERFRSVSVLASNYERTLGACQIVFAILKERLIKLNKHLHRNCGKLNWQLKVKVVWNDGESAMLLRNIQGQASAISLLLNAIQMKTQTEMFGLLSRKENKSILKTASDDADTLSLAHESNTSIDLLDGESVTTSKLDSREFDFDFEIINTAAYRKVFNMARSKLLPKNGSRAYSPPQASTSSGVSAPETVGLISKLPQKNGSGVYSPPQASTSGGANAPEIVGLPSVNAHAAIHPAVVSPESEPFSSRPNASSRDIRSQSVLPKDTAEAAGDGTGGKREEEHNANSENQPTSTSKKGESRIGEYNVGKTIGTGRKGKVKLAWKKDHNHQFAIKFIRREPDALDTRPRNTLRGFLILRSLSHPNIIRLHNMFATDSYSAVVLEYMPGGTLAEYVAKNTRLTEGCSQKLFAQIISAVGYLHRNCIPHSTLSCFKVLLDSNQNAVLTGFSNVKAFDKYPVSMGMLDRMFFCNETQADLWSCGIILYFMLAGYLPFSGLSTDLGASNARQQLYSRGRTIVTFPESFPVRAQDLVRPMLDAKQFIALAKVAGHTWLTDYTHVVSDLIESNIS